MSPKRTAYIPEKESGRKKKKTEQTSGVFKVSKIYFEVNFVAFGFIWELFCAFLYCWNVNAWIGVILPIR